jgi:putative methyltransferase
MNVLISSPNFKRKEVYLPLFWGRVREYCEFQDSRDFSFVTFLDPIFLASIDPQKYDFTCVDILFLSCYVWNWKLNLQIAQEARLQKPNIVIVAGGPSALYKNEPDSHLFDVCDLVLPGEGEKICAEIIQTMHEGNCVREQKYYQKRLDLSNARSPYVEYLKDYKRFIEYARADYKNSLVKFHKAKQPDITVVILLETNRGCPYNCAFCDWGSVTNSKLKRYSKDIVKKELSTVCRELRPNTLFITDANFGIVPDDIEYAKILGEIKTSCGYPSNGVYFAEAKNNKKNVNEIMKIFHSYGLLNFVQVNFQHTDMEVLEAIDRSNINIENIAESLSESFRLGVPMVGAIIIGNPKDTKDKWRAVLEEMVETNFHDLRIHDFMILPNAPAADSKYIQKYNIKTLNTKFNGNELGILKEIDGIFDADFIIETDSYTKEDYIDMQVMSYTILGYHILNFTKFIATLLKRYYNIGYMDFYEDLCNTPTLKSHLDVVKAFITDWVNGYVDLKYIPFKNFKVSPDVYLKINAIKDEQQVFSEIKELLVNYGLEPEFAKDIIAFQRRTIVGPWKQEDVIINYNLDKIFGHILRMAPNDYRNLLPIKKQKTILSSNQKFVGGFNNAPLKYDISSIKSFYDWVSSNIHNGDNIRTPFNYYNEVIGL